MVTLEQVRAMLPKRLSYQNKGDFGHVLIIGGSRGMSGSVCMAGESALRTGAGLLTIAVPNAISDIVAIKTTECMTLPLSDEAGVFSLKAAQELKAFLPKATTIVVGMGARICPGLLKILEFIITSFSGTLVIDADGLNVISEHMELLDLNRKSKIIVTPHPGEMARLLHTTSSKVQEQRAACATQFAQDKNVTVVLKGENTIIADGNRLYINPTGNVGMATAGSGDVLAGMIGAFAAQGLKPDESAVCGCYIHGLSGDIAAQQKTVYSLMATDIIRNIPMAFKKIL